MFHDNHQATIKVMGLGGGGSNAVQYMVEKGVEGVEFIAANTDQQSLNSLQNVDHVIQLGRNVTKGLGAGANPEHGKMAAEEEIDEIRNQLEGTDMLFIAAGMGGGTGTGSSIVVAEVAKDLGILTVAVVTKPFPFEGRPRMEYANTYTAELMKTVDSIITIPNERLLSVLPKGTPFTEAFAACNDVLYEAVLGISELITKPGFINVDFADVSTVMSKQGLAMMGIGRASGDDKAQRAAHDAITSPLLDNIELSDAKGVLVNLCAGPDLSIEEYEAVGNKIQEITNQDATIVMGMTIDPDISDEVRITVVATGLKSKDGAFESAKRSHLRHRNPSLQSTHDDAELDAEHEITPDADAEATAETKTENDVPAFLRKSNQ